MPNIATVLKAEVTRLARKELRAETDSLKKALASQRSEVQALKHRVKELESTLKRLAQQSSGAVLPSRAQTNDLDAAELRFRPSGMATNRKRLGLSASDFGLLIGATGQSVYAWESGKAKPRAQYLMAIAALRRAGKKEVAARLSDLKGVPS